MKKEPSIFRVIITTLFMVTVICASAGLAEEAATPEQSAVEPASAKVGELIRVDAQGNKLIDAQFKEVELATLLRMIARETGASIIVDGEVKGTVSIDFNGVSADEALESVLNIGELEKVSLGSVMVVRPRQKQWRSRSFTVHHINISDLSETLTNLFSQRATLEVDANTNTFLASAPEHILSELSLLVQQLDVPQKQVMIEAAIVEVSLDDETKMGVNLMAILEKADLGASIQSLGFASDPETLPNPEGLFAEGNFFLGKSDKSVDTLVEALQTLLDTTVLSHPRVLGISGQEAEIIVGQKLGFRVTTTTQTGTQETIQFLEVGTQLKLTPNITENNDVIMDIHPEVSDGSISEDGLPNENTTEITARVRVPNGQTIVLGGLIRERQDRVIKRVPFLGSIPFLGALFRRTVDSIKRSEILVFMTPRVMTPSLGAAQAQEDIKRIGKSMKQGMGDSPKASDALLSNSTEADQSPEKEEQSQ